MLVPDRLATELRQIVEITQMLITAGSESIAESNKSKLSKLRLLMSTTVVADQRALFKYKRACMYRNQFKLRVELIELLIKHESCRMGSTILRAAVAIANIRLKITGIPRPGVNPRDEMIDSLGSIFRFFVLACAGVT